jgi:hypothetical protein
MFLKNKYVIAGGISVLSFSAGAVLSYFITSKKMRDEIDQIVEGELTAAKKIYAVMYKKDTFADPGEALKYYEDAEARKTYERRVSEIQYIPGKSPDERDEQTERKDELEAQESMRVAEEQDVDEIPGIGHGTVGSHVLSTVVPQNPPLAFADQSPNDDPFDLEEEEKHRTPDKPYILSFEEFNRGEFDYQQITLSYFEGDDTLCDEKDEPITDSDTVVGDDNLTRFGHGSKDNNILYIRNEKMDLDFEVVRSPGKFIHEILGFDDTISHEHHSGSKKNRKFRGDDGWEQAIR